MFLKKSLIALGLFFAFLFIWAKPSFAGNYKSYDENVVRAFNKVKIMQLKPDISLSYDASEAQIDKAVYEYLKSERFFQRKLKGKPGLFFVETKPQILEFKQSDKSIKIERNLLISKIYILKNPEKFMFALDKTLPIEVISDRGTIKNKIENNMTAYAIVSEKIDKARAPFILKTLKFTTNSFLNLMIIIPKLGFGYLINPPLSWLKIGTPSDIYKDIMKEAESLSIGEKDYREIKYFEPNVDLGL